MPPVSSFIGFFLPVSLGIVAVYSFLLLRNRQELLGKLLETTGRKEWMVSGYLVFGFGMVTLGVHFIPSVPDPSHFASPFQTGPRAFLFGLSGGIPILLAAVSYGFFKSRRHPELYLVGLQLFMTTLGLALYLMVHSDYGSLIFQGFIGVAILLILAVERREIGVEMKRFILLSLSHMVLGVYALWTLFTGGGGLGLYRGDRRRREGQGRGADRTETGRFSFEGHWTFL
ncbi:MAG: hypothetical protein HY760_02540 [Nitrospirae bacterium]|nr:hypothetical protein [Nitrospirota bacterium]